MSAEELRLVLETIQLSWELWLSVHTEAIGDILMRIAGEMQ